VAKEVDMEDIVDLVGDASNRQDSEPCVCFLMCFIINEEEEEREEQRGSVQKGEGAGDRSEISCCRLRNKTRGNRGLFMLGAGASTHEMRTHE